MYRTDFLFATPSFVGGMASAIDLGATLVSYNEAPTPEDADALAIEADWRVTENDFIDAVNDWQGFAHEEEEA